ncbi:uncharacterized protein PGTG_04306 [Puccinia graminis f. sp. tritici CRL 75-36-700-3]|uniref:Uncharacterized protein n=1 Tax=Puccinia graminis f. sp. tritici (strain CRL 75-36-700-3 / race SCCL) TaxID=418459 RepID=E3K1Y1_PUCGT|nr:uncharacterized protein PGTG_04306 [Puccinia graminis f. sp. tritici CRL 75-36-700-3]EFP78350.1 hypothetical protein PGTG_04306 [Puccinia graminis f. sp. tritici CRL 75-36-700-3]
MDTTKTSEKQTTQSQLKVGGKVSIEAPSGYFRTFLRVWMGVHFIQKSDIESHTEPCR